MPNKLQEPELLPSTIETIDSGFYEHVNENFNIHVVTNGGFKKVPVLWMATERAYQIKSDKSLRDSVGRLKLPLVTVERTSMTKDPAFKGSFQANLFPFKDGPRGYRGGTVCIGRRIMQDKTRNFANADYNRANNGAGTEPNIKGNKKIVYETISIPIPIYVEIDYAITLRTEYQEQMNDIMTPFIRVSNAHRRVMIEHNSNQYEAFIQEAYAMSNNISSYTTNERKYETTINMNVIGYLIGDGKNQKQPRVVRRENPVQIRFASERIIVQDEDGEFRF